MLGMSGRRSRHSTGSRLGQRGTALAAAGAQLGTIVHRGGTPQFYEWPLKAQVINDWIAGKRPNHGLIIWGKAPGKAVSFASSEAPEVEQRPQLLLTVSIPIEAMIKKALGSDDIPKGVTRVKKVDTYINPENDRITINVDWRIDAAVFPKSELIQRATADVRELVTIGRRLGPALSHIDIRGFYGTESRFGQGSGILYINANYTRNALAKVKWRNFSTADVFEIADSMELHPDFRALMTQATE